MNFLLWAGAPFTGQSLGAATDGLIESAGQDIGHGLAELSTALTGSAADLDDVAEDPSAVADAGESGQAHPWVTHSSLREACAGGSGRPRSVPSVRASLRRCPP